MRTYIAALSLHPACKGLIRALLAVCIWLAPACVQTVSAEGRRIEWLERPWELRYILYVTDDWVADLGSAKRWKAKADPGDLDQQWEEYFSPQIFFASRNKWALPGEGLSTMLIEFDQEGKVKTPNTFGASLYGKTDQLLRVVLSSGDYAKQPRFHLGYWFMGSGDVSTHWAPGLCDVKTIPSPFAKTDTAYLYGPVFKPYPHSQTFGCREWAYQLQHPDRPYMDITSYLHKKDDPDGSGTYVRVTMGWSRFSDERKPVIGKHEEDWYCFHDCPDGMKPGLIPDIKVWAKKNGWPAPKRPTRIPVFPDPPAKAGTYPH
jgi:hypothetical protein